MGDYSAFSPMADKFLSPDGSVSTASGATVTGPNQAGAAEYLSRSPMADKFLQPDGSNKTLSEIMSGANSNQAAVSVPDYENRSTVMQGGGTYTVTANGFVQRELQVASTTPYINCRITANGKQIWAINHGGLLNTGTYDYTSPIFPVKIGDVITASVEFPTSGGTALVNNLYFYNPVEIGIPSVPVAKNNIVVGSGFGVKDSGKSVFDINTAIAIANRLYDGADLTVKFSAEISAFTSPWTWIQNRIKTGNFTGINVADYIPMAVQGTGYDMQIAGINTYKNFGDTAIQSHIDFVSRTLFDTFRRFNAVGYNNGLSGNTNPWTASELCAYINSLAANVPNGTGADPPTAAVDFTASGVWSVLPADLQSVIIPKILNTTIRYSQGLLLTDDNGSGTVNLGNLWLLDETEVYGRVMRSTRAEFSGAGSVQYPLFANNGNRVKRLNTAGTRARYWLSNARTGSSNTVAAVYYSGASSYGTATDSTYYSFPICFRIA